MGAREAVGGRHAGVRKECGVARVPVAAQRGKKKAEAALSRTTLKQIKAEPAKGEHSPAVEV